MAKPTPEQLALALRQNLKKRKRVSGDQSEPPKKPKKETESLTTVRD
jgi:hypothetical protein